MRRFTIDEISAVDRPAQGDARALLMKAAATTTTRTTGRATASSPRRRTSSPGARRSRTCSTAPPRSGRRRPARRSRGPTRRCSSPTRAARPTGASASCVKRRSGADGRRGLLREYEELTASRPARARGPLAARRARSAARRGGRRRRARRRRQERRRREAAALGRADRARRARKDGTRGATGMNRDELEREPREAPGRALAAREVDRGRARAHLLGGEVRRPRLRRHARPGRAEAAAHQGLNPQRVLDVALHEEMVDEVEAEHLARSKASTDERPTIDPYQQLPEGPSTVPAAGDFCVEPDDGEAP